MVLRHPPRNSKRRRGAIGKNRPLIKDTPSLHSPLTEARSRQENCVGFSTMRPGPILTPVISDRKSHSAILRSRGLRRAKFLLRARTRREEGEQHGKKFRS